MSPLGAKAWGGLQCARQQSTGRACGETSVLEPRPGLGTTLLKHCRARRQVACGLSTDQQGCCWLTLCPRLAAHPCAPAQVSPADDPRVGLRRALPPPDPRAAAGWVGARGRERGGAPGCGQAPAESGPPPPLPLAQLMHTTRPSCCLSPADVVARTFQDHL